MKLEQLKVSIIGLGYVGLPIAIEVAKRYPTVGFDIKSNRIDNLRNGIDETLEVDRNELIESSVSFSYDPEDLKSSNLYVVTVPTPVDSHKKPDLNPLQKSSELIGRYLKKGDIVVYESTVFPGCTEEFCVPILESVSGLKFNKDFFCGYSPERINPGDKKHRLTTIKKVTSGSNEQVADLINQFYQSFITAGTHLASSIKVAEAAKVIENTQRDLNIAFVNELSIIFGKMNIDTMEVLEAAGTKWNFLPFVPGLVGGHCIGVDPYYLTYKSEGLGYRPEVILAGRRINDNMGAHVAGLLVKKLAANRMPIVDAKVLVLGITFKENCPDIRNSRVIDVVRELNGYSMDIDVYDPQASAREVKKEYGVNLLSNINYKEYSTVILAVAHNELVNLDWGSIRNSVGIIFDLKSVLPKGISDLRL